MLSEMRLPDCGGRTSGLHFAYAAMRHDDRGIYGGGLGLVPPAFLGGSLSPHSSMNGLPHSLTRRVIRWKGHEGSRFTARRQVLTRCVIDALRHSSPRGCRASRKRSYPRDIRRRAAAGHCRTASLREGVSRRFRIVLKLRIPQLTHGVISAGLLLFSSRGSCFAREEVPRAATFPGRAGTANREPRSTGIGCRQEDSQTHGACHPHRFQL